MPQDKKESAVDFLNNINGDVFKEESVAEEIVEEVEEEKPLPFHKDPKVQRFIDKQVESRLKDFKPSAEQQFRRETDDINLPKSFVQLVGNDTDEKKQVLKDLSDYFGSLKGEARKEFLAEMQEQQQREAEADTKAQEELESGFEQIEETYNVDLSSNTASSKKMRAEFVEYVRKIAPKNEEGEVAAFPDLISAFETYQEMNRRAPASRAKELASRGLTRSTDASTATPAGRSWKDVDRFFDKLKANGAN